MGLNKKVIYKSNEGIIGQDSFKDKAFIPKTKSDIHESLSGAVTDIHKSLSNAIEDSRASAIVADMDTFEEALIKHFDDNVRTALFGNGYPQKEEDTIMQILNRIFNNRFARHFIKELSEEDFKIYFYRHFEEIFTDNFYLSFATFLDTYPNAPKQDISTTSNAYKELFSKILQDTYTEIHLQYNSETQGNSSKTVSHMDQDTDDEKGNMQIYVN